MSIDIVRGELERLFSLEEMMALSADLLGLPPGDVGEPASKASFAPRLTDKALEIDALEALVDAVLASRTEVDARVPRAGAEGDRPPEELKAGDKVGPFTVGKKIGEGRGPSSTRRRRTGSTGRSRSSGGRHAGRAGAAAVPAPRAPRGQGPAREPAGRAGGGISDGRAWVAYAPIEGQPLSARIARRGRSTSTRRATCSAGCWGRSGRCTTSSSRTARSSWENIIVGRGEGGAPRPVLVDIGGDRLLLATSWQSTGGHQDGEPGASSAGAWPTWAAISTGSGRPLRGALGQAAVRGGERGRSGHRPPHRAGAAPSATAPRGWVGRSSTS